MSTLESFALMVMGMRMNAKGEYQKIELYGPATYAMWISCYNIFMNCLLMLDAVGLGKLTTYRRRQDRYQSTYGHGTRTARC